MVHWPQQSGGLALQQVVYLLTDMLIQRVLLAWSLRAFALVQVAMTQYASQAGSSPSARHLLRDTVATPCSPGADTRVACPTTSAVLHAAAAAAALAEAEAAAAATAAAAAAEAAACAPAGPAFAELLAQLPRCCKPAQHAELARVLFALADALLGGADQVEVRVFVVDIAWGEGQSLPAS
jgi:hypothetical protein